MIIERVWLLLEMEMVCESIEDSCSGSCWQELDTSEETPLPRVVNAASLSFSDKNDEHKSSPVKRPASRSAAELPTKHRRTGTDCRVAVDRSTGRPVRAAAKSNIVSGRLKSRVKTECDERSDAVEQIPRLTNQQNSVAPNLPISNVLGRNVFNNNKTHCPNSDQSYMSQAVRRTPVATDAVPLNAAVAGATTTSFRANTGTKPGGVERDISVILLNSAQLPKSATSDGTDTSATEQPQDVSILVLSMLQQQNIIPMPLGNDDSIPPVTHDENGQQQQTDTDSARGTHDTSRLQRMLRVSNKKNIALEKKLKAEQAKVNYLLAQVTSLKDTVEQLSRGTSTNSECTRDSNSSKDSENST